MEPVITSGKKKSSKSRSAPAASLAAVATKSKPARRKVAVKKAPTRKTVVKKSSGAPARMAKPAKPDDLKLISGVGPKIEKILHGLGIYTYRQVASWKKAERSWVDEKLKFKGRIEREDWVAQAKALAKGGAKEYIKVFGKKPR